MGLSHSPCRAVINEGSYLPKLEGDALNKLLKSKKCFKNVCIVPIPICLVSAGCYKLGYEFINLGYKFF